MHQNKQSVYLAGGLTNNWHDIVIAELKDRFIFFNPKTHNLKASTQYTSWDLHFVKQCNILFGYIEKDNTSGYGLTLEIGYASALNKTIILVDERSKIDKSFAKQFLIVRESCSVVFEDFFEGITYLSKFSNHLI